MTGTPQIGTMEPPEDLPWSFEMGGRMNAADTVVGATITQVPEGRVPGSVPLTIGAASVAGTIVQARISGGTPGERYRVEVLATTAAGYTVEGEFAIWVSAQ